jgi:hypothetical protein
MDQYLNNESNNNKIGKKTKFKLYFVQKQLKVEDHQELNQENSFDLTIAAY